MTDKQQAPARTSSDAPASGNRNICGVALYQPGQPAHSYCDLRPGHDPIRPHNFVPLRSAADTPPGHPYAAPCVPLPGEVALAFRTDECATCHRPINVNEPIYRAASSRGVNCAGCTDANRGRYKAAADAYARNERPDLQPLPGDMVTSVLLRYAARLLKTGDYNRSPANELRTIGYELAARADAIQRITTGDVAGDRPASWGQVLSLIGEVRS